MEPSGRRWLRRCIKFTALATFTSNALFCAARPRMGPVACLPGGARPESCKFRQLYAHHRQGVFGHMRHCIAVTTVKLHLVLLHHYAPGKQS